MDRHGNVERVHYPHLLQASWFSVQFSKIIYSTISIYLGIKCTKENLLALLYELQTETGKIAKECLGESSFRLQRECDVMFQLYNRGIYNSACRTDLVHLLRKRIYSELTQLTVKTIISLYTIKPSRYCVRLWYHRAPLDEARAGCRWVDGSANNTLPPDDLLMRNSYVDEFLEMCFISILIFDVMIGLWIRWTPTRITNST